jgi:2-keto-3-deoxy-L-fuconate dehydrogenase
VLPIMVEQGRGSIVAQSSAAALVGTPRNAAYSAAKGGVISLARQVAIDYAADGVRANALCPGTVWTPLVADAYRHRGELQRLGSEEATRAAIAERLPVQRLADPVEVAGFALYLLSDESRWVTGGIHVIDGGLTAAAYSPSATSLRPRE